MMRFPSQLPELEAAPADMAWKLVDPFFRQIGLMVSGSLAFMALSVIGFWASGSVWYLLSFTYTAAVGAWRLGHHRAYLRGRESASPTTWAWRAVHGTWATGVGWGAWGFALFDKQKTFVMVVISAHAGCMLVGAARNASIPTAAVGQVLLASMPIFLICLVSGDIYLTLLGMSVALSAGVVLKLTKILHQQTLELLQREAEKSVLVERLETTNRDLAVVNRHLENLAATDALTNVANRRAFDLAAAREWRRLSREALPLGMIILDVDHFKLYNDLYGHPAGDVCLRIVAAAAESVIKRPGDLLARYGGEEFAVILPGASPNGALQIAEQLCRAVAEHALPHDASPFRHVTVSVGVACMLPDEDSVLEQLTARADSALYMAKRGGRNRVHMIKPEASAAGAAPAAGTCCERHLTRSRPCSYAQSLPDTLSG